MIERTDVRVKLVPPSQRQAPSRILDELEWRFNNRSNPYLFRDTLLRLIEADTLTFKELVHR